MTADGANAPGTPDADAIAEGDPASDIAHDATPVDGDPSSDEAVAATPSGVAAGPRAVRRPRATARARATASDGGDRLVVGLVRGLHGLRGAVRIEVLTDDARRFEPGSALFVEGTERRLSVVWSQSDGPGILVRFGEVTGREAAEPLMNTYLEATAEATERIPGEYYWHEVVGTPVETDAGESLGTVDDVFRAGGGEVYVVRGGSRGEVLIPAVQSVVRSFDPAGGSIVVDAAVLGLDEAPAPRRPRGRRSSKGHALPPRPDEADGAPPKSPADDGAPGS